MPVGAGIEGFLPDSDFARFVAACLKNEYLRLVDVGCAGGLAPGWRAFGDRLAAIGFDGDAQEVERLAAAETNPAVRYVARLVGVPADHPLKAKIAGRPWWTGFGFGRLAYERQAALRAERLNGAEQTSLTAYLDWHSRERRDEPAHIADTDYADAFKVYRPSPADIEAARNPTDAGPVYLSAFVRANGFDDLDFLKLDIDGPDYEVLRSATDLLTRPSLLGVAIEVCFFGSHDANDNSFHNVDRLMREKGFDLFGLSVRPYASAALPSTYLNAYPAGTYTGRPMQGDAIYLRDLASTVRWADSQAVSAEKLAKLAALFALFGLTDQAAEVLLTHRDRLGAVLDCQAGLNMLARKVQEDMGWPILDYPDYIAAFEREDPRFFGLYARREAWLAGLIKAGRNESSLHERIAALEAECDRRREQASAPPSKTPFAKAIAQFFKGRAA